MIRNIVFDIGVVLTNFNWRNLFRSLGYTEEVAQRLGDATVESPDWPEYDRGVLTEEEVLERFVENDPEIEKEIREVVADLHEILLPAEYAIPWVKSLKERGYKVFYLSNFSVKIKRECADALTFLPYMDGGIMSYEIHIMKPEPEIYRRFLKKYDLSADECVYIDDLKKNVEAGLKEGFHSILFESYEQAHEELERFLKARAGA